LFVNTLSEASTGCGGDEELRGPAAATNINISPVY